jgi:hypothetical protein
MFQKKIGEENGPKPIFMWGIEKCVIYINSPSFESKPKFNVEKHEYNVSGYWSKVLKTRSTKHTIDR